MLIIRKWWNNVFMEFNAGDIEKKLPSQHVDTGMDLSVYVWLCKM
jgi:alanyl-tRNA synthetase